MDIIKYIFLPLFKSVLYYKDLKNIFFVCLILECLFKTWEVDELWGKLVCFIHLVMLN